MMTYRRATVHENHCALIKQLQPDLRNRIGAFEIPTHIVDTYPELIKKITSHVHILHSYRNTRRGVCTYLGLHPGFAEVPSENAKVPAYDLHFQYIDDSTENDGYWYGFRDVKTRQMVVNNSQ